MVVWFLVIDASTSIYLVYAEDDAEGPESGLAMWMQSADLPVLIENQEDGRSLRVEPEWLPEGDLSNAVSDIEPLKFALQWANTAVKERDDDVVVYTSKLAALGGFQ